MTPHTKLTYSGTSQRIAEWALDYGIAPAVIIARLERGLSVEAAITKPMVVAKGQKLRGAYLDRYIASRHRPSARAIRYEFNGEALTLEGWAQRVGINKHTIRNRLRSGWPIERALSQEVDPSNGGRTPGVAFNFAPSMGTGAGGTAQEIPEITFSAEAIPE